MDDVLALPEQWQSDLSQVRQRICPAPTPRERWHALWLLAQVAEALQRNPHTIGDWLDNFRWPHL
jgi:hypothetical protein